MFSFICIMIDAICICAAILIVHVRRKRNKPEKLGYIIALTLLSIFVLHITYSTTMPESYFINFKTPESAYKYLYANKISDVVYGENSALVIGINSDNTVNPMITIKNNEKWRFTPPSNSMPRYLGSYKGLDIFAFQNKQTSDVYILTLINADEIEGNITFNDEPAAAEIKMWDGNTCYCYSYYYLETNPTDITMSMGGTEVKRFERSKTE